MTAKLADLQAGDVVELTDHYGVTITGPLHHFGAAHSSGLKLGASDLVVRRVDGCLAGQWVGWNITVLESAPRPLYANHPRTKPVTGDVVRVEFGDAYGQDDYTDVYYPGPDPTRPWLNPQDGTRFTTQQAIPGIGNNARAVARLLVDGETGQVVQ